MLSSLDNLPLVLAGFASKAWSIISESTVLGLPKLPLPLSFLQSERNFFNYLVTLLRLFFTANVFGFFHDIIALFKLVKYKFPN